MNEEVREYLSNLREAVLKGKYEEALEWCRKVIAEAPQTLGAYRAAGRICMILDRWGEGQNSGFRS